MSDCRDSLFSEIEAAPIIDQVLNGLEAVHASGIVHRDLKCSNIILCSEIQSAEARAVLTDFGLACQSRSALQTLQEIANGEVAGTPAYMPPEQLQGEEVTAAADIHALGAVVFRMFTGHLPFEAPNALSAAMKRLNTKAQSPSIGCPSLSKNWEKTILACLEYLPDRRPQSAQAVREMLLWGGRSVVSRRTILLAGLGMGAITGTAMLPWGHLRFRTNRPTPTEALRHWRLGQEFVKNRNIDQLNQAVYEYKQALLIAPSHEDSWIGLSEAYAALANWGFANQHDSLEKARQAANRAIVLNPKNGTAYAALGYTISIDVHEWRKAESTFAKALQLSPDQPDVMFWYATHLGRLGKHEAAIGLLRRALTMEPGDLRVNHQLATEYFRARRYSDYFRQCEELVRVQPFQGDSHLALARAYERLGKYQQAIAECVEAERYKIDQPQLLSMYSILNADEGKRQTALGLAKKLEKLWRARPMESLTVAMTFAYLGDAQKAVDFLESGFGREDSAVIKIFEHPILTRFKMTVDILRLSRNLGSTLKRAKHRVEFGFLAGRL